MQDFRENVPTYEELRARDAQKRAERRYLSVRTGIASVAVAALLVLLKAWAVTQSSALSVAASLADSGLDVIASSAGLVAMIYAARPADDEHRFGHGPAEDLAALGQALLVAISGLYIGWQAIARLFFGADSQIANEPAAMMVMTISLLLTAGLVIWQRYVVRRTGSRVIEADSLHYLGDLVPNIGALISLFVAARWGEVRIDSVVALGAALMLLWGARKIFAGAWGALMGRAATDDVHEEIGEICDRHPGVLGYHDLRTRTAGGRLFIQIHAEMDGEQPLRDAHTIAASLRRAVLASFPDADVIIHQDVYGGPRKRLE